MILCICPNPSIDTYAWLDEFKNGTVNRIRELEEFPGGKGVHVAFALNELGCDVSLFGNWAGNNGQWLKKISQKMGIHPSGIVLKGNNRKCYTFRTKEKRFDNTELLEPGPYMTVNNWEKFLNRFTKQIKFHDLICMSGSWPKGAPDDAYLQLLQICNKNRTKAILDCSGIQLENALKTNFFGLHINEHEANEAFGTHGIEEVFDFLKDKVSLVALTKGKEGLYLGSKNKWLHANVTINKVISSVGSGDCLTAGIAYGIVHGLTLEDTAKYGVACGAANCLNEDLGMLKASEVQRLLRKAILQ